MATLNTKWFIRDQEEVVEVSITGRTKAAIDAIFDQIDNKFDYIIQERS